MPSMPGHQRNVSQGQHLIVDRPESDEEDVDKLAGRAAPEGGGGGRTHEAISMENDDAPYGNGGVYPGSSPPFTPSRPQDNKSTGLCSPQLRSNIKVIIGSIVLTCIGAVLLGIGCWVAMNPDEDHSGMQHWVFFFAGLVCFIPGFYHVYYVTCTLCGRPGYSFDKLPTFNR
ncbi:hypothetical protein CAEBREN_22489 [Caenorhabditis brenneri]|uniref:Transmembrane protein 230 n=1 Tax=Caenorhabditis brenneri TaxID=135651 RepID=G0NWL3_CAEBE|nr:hypothetical protein CAEBREN_05508 [Caenorhabditis brenneri]EGT43993.1 hypothetical protein CAEBREN_22489 [Caenorhabditis brenneri]